VTDDGGCGDFALAEFISNFYSGEFMHNALPVVIISFV
jgi:hypothetical protein